MPRVVVEVANEFVEEWIARFGDPTALSCRIRWDGFTAKDFATFPIRLMQGLSMAACRAEAALRRRDVAAAEVVLAALDHGREAEAPLGRLLAAGAEWAAHRSLLREAAGAGWAGPVQAALGRVALAGGITALHEAQARLNRDAKALADHLGFRAAAVCKVEAMGDPHAGGRRVLRFEDACGQAVFLKPRPMDGERLMDRLAHALGPLGEGIRLPKMLARRTHGWVAEARPGDGTALRAAGALLAVADLAAVVDLHAENLLPATNGASVLDAEMALHPDLPLDLVTPQARAAAAALRSGVLRTGLLPEPHQPRALCGFAAWGAAHSIGTGDAAEVAEGYAQALGRLCSEGGARAALERVLPAHGTVRLLLRRSSAYARLLDRLRDPKATPDAVALALQLEMLRIGMARNARRRPRLWGVAAAEATSLLRGDIPRFWMAWDATEVREGNAKAGPCATLAMTPRAAALARAARFAPARAATQARVARRVLLGV